MENEMDVKNMFLVLKKRKWMIALITMFVLMLGAFYSFYVLKPVYDSKISIVIGKDPEQADRNKYDYNDIMMYQNLVKTYTRIATSRAVAESAEERLQGMPQKMHAGIDEIQAHVSAAPRSGTQILDIKYRDRDKHRAKTILDEVAAAFVEKAMLIYPDGNVQIIDEAVVPRAASSLNRKLDMAISMLCGMILGIGAALVLENMDGSIKSQEEAEHYLGMQVVGVIPRKC